MTDPRTVCDWPPEDGAVLVEHAGLLLRQACHLEARGQLVSPEVFYRYGGELSAVTGYLADLTGKLARQVESWPDRTALYDDAGENPPVRVKQARDALVEVSRHLGAALVAAQAYHNAVGHLGLDLDDDAGGEV